MDESNKGYLNNFKIWQIWKRVGIIGWVKFTEYAKKDIKIEKQELSQ